MLDNETMDKIIDDAITAVRNRKPLFEVGTIQLFEPEEMYNRPNNTFNIAKSMTEKAIEDVWNNYGGAILENASNTGIPVESALSVFCTEAGRAYDTHSKLIIIRFEPNVFLKKTKKLITAKRGTQDKEWDNFRRAVEINEEAALWSTSYGLPQLMGFNYTVTRFSTMKEVLENFQRSCSEQVKGFFDFVKHNKLIKYVVSKDWPSFVERYNGKGQVDHYTSVLTSYLMSTDNLKSKGAVFK